MPRSKEELARAVVDVLGEERLRAAQQHPGAKTNLALQDDDVAALRAAGVTIEELNRHGFITKPSRDHLFDFIPVESVLEAAQASQAGGRAR